MIKYKEIRGITRLPMRIKNLNTPVFISSFKEYFPSSELFDITPASNNLVI